MRKYAQVSALHSVVIEFVESQTCQKMLIVNIGSIFSQYRS